MYDLFSFLTQVLLILFQGYYLQWFYGEFMRTRFHRYRKSNFIIMLIWISERAIMTFLWKTGYSNMVLQVKWIITVTLLVLVTILLYKADGRLKLYLSVTFFAISEISFLLGHMTMELGQVIFPFWNWCFMKGYLSSADAYMICIQGSITTLQLIMSVATVLLLRTGLKNIVRWYREKEYSIHRTELFFILTPGVAGLLFCNLLRMLMITVEDNIPLTLYERYPGMLLLVPAILILLFASIQSGIKLFQDMISLNREKSSRIILERQMGNIQEHIGEMERVYGNMRSVRHDMRNHLAVLTRLVDQDTEGENGEIKDYLSQMEQTVESIEFRFRTGNTVADTILNIKYHEASRSMPGLRMETGELIFPKEFQVQNYDIAVILCNALDNAVEACCRMKEGQRWIRLSSMERGKMFFLEIANSFNGHLRQKRQQEFPQTDKEDKEAHGMGLYNIKNAVQRYGGAVDWTVQDKTFVLNVMLKNERKCEIDRK